MRHAARLKEIAHGRKLHQVLLSAGAQQSSQPGSVQIRGALCQRISALQKLPPLPPAQKRHQGLPTKCLGLARHALCLHKQRLGQRQLTLCGI